MQDSKELKEKREKLIKKNWRIFLEIIPALKRGKVSNIAGKMGLHCKEDMWSRKWGSYLLVARLVCTTMCNKGHNRDKYYIESHSTTWESEIMN